MNILDLPEVILIEFFESLSYEEVDNLRSVCKIFDEIGRFVLASGLRKIQHQHKLISEQVEALGRQENLNWLCKSHSPILLAIEWRLLVHPYYSKNKCLPGWMLDEMRRLLLMVSKSRENLDAYQIVTDLRAKFFKFEQHLYIEE